MNIVVLISGSGSNLQAIMDACADGRIRGRVAGVLSNRADAFGLERAARTGIPTATVSHRDYASREDFDAAMQAIIDRWTPDVVVLAGFMRILTPGFVRHYEGRLLNIHPSLLPRYKGLHTHRRVLACGDRRHGCTVHFVNAELDGGPAIASGVLDVHPNDDEQSLTQKVHVIEHRIYPQVISWMAAGRLAYRNGQPELDGLPLAEPVRLLS